MRHKKKTAHLQRESSHRRAMLANMASSLIMEKRISTTVPKAKALRTYIEPLITKSKADSLHSRRIVFRYLQNKYAVSELFREISPKVMSRPGGYTRILKTGVRQGDSADMCIIELVDYNENMLKAKEEESQEKAGSGRRRRRRRSKKKSSSEAASAQQAGETSESQASGSETHQEVTSGQESEGTAGEEDVATQQTEEPQQQAQDESQAKEQSDETDAQKTDNTDENENKSE